MRDNYVALLEWLALSGFFVQAAGLIWHQMSWVPTTAGVAVLILWIITAGFAIQASETGVTYWISKTFDQRWARSIRIATIMIPLSLVFVGTPTYGVRIIPQTGATTLDNSIIIAMPLWHSVVFVTDSYDRGVTVLFTTRDDIPLRCTVKAHGMKLDWRDGGSLKAFLLDATSAGNPADYIGTTLDDALSRSATAVLAQKTADDIERQRRLVIPYRIGTPLGETFGRLDLVLGDGTVSSSCAVAFSN